MNDQSVPGIAQPWPNQSDIPATGAAARRRRYRETHARVDFVPRAEVVEIINQAIEQNPQMSVSAVIDELVIAGATHFNECVGDKSGPDAVESQTPGRVNDEVR